MEKGMGAMAISKVITILIYNGKRLNSHDHYHLLRPATRKKGKEQKEKMKKNHNYF